MSKEKRIGKCRLCQEIKELSFEHVPPKGAFNDTRVKMVSVETMLKTGTFYGPELKNQYGKIIQQGRGDYYLCSDCNSKTGQWYASQYIGFVRALASVLAKVDLNNTERIKIGFEEANPVALFNQALTMFCDINEGLAADDSIKEYLLDKESKEFNADKYKIFMYIHKGAAYRQNGFIVVGNLNGMMITLSEISAFPIGLVLYENIPNGYNPKGVDISNFARCDYNNNYKIEMDIPILESNMVFSGDYRTEAEIEEQIKQW